MNDPTSSLTLVAHWSRFVIKQVYDRLRPKRSFTRHPAASSSPQGPNISMHDSRSIQHGWEWYEMGFFVHWEPHSGATIFCFDLPPHFQGSIQSAFTSSTGNVVLSDPYSIFAILLHELLPLYDNSVWSLRNHICGWEAVSLSIPTTALLHPLTDRPRRVQRSPTIPCCTKWQDMRSMLVKH